MNGLKDKKATETITLLNGTVLECYPLEHPEAMVDNEMKLDTTGTYLIVGKSKPKPIPVPTNDEQKEKEEKIFLSNAFLFLQNRDRIMSDSRMSLCPVPVQSGLAYMGTGGFNRPTLGVYLEWWLSCERATIRKEDNTKWLVYRIAGSPLSGANKCGIVNKDGDTDTKSLQGPFSPIWQSFMSINKRYDEAKSLYQAYTLEEVVEIMAREGIATVDDKDIQILFLENEIRQQHADMTNEIRRLEREIERIKFQVLYLNKEKLDAFMKDYKGKEEHVLRREKEIDEECKDLRCKLRLGLINNKQLQNRISPLKKEKRENVSKLQNYCMTTLEELFPELRFTIKDVEEFFEDLRSAGPQTKRD